jgi:hypothetical protein
MLKILQIWSRITISEELFKERRPTQGKHLIAYEHNTTISQHSDQVIIDALFSSLLTGTFYRLKFFIPPN